MCYPAAVRQVDDPGRIRRLNGPLNAEQLPDLRVRPSRGEAASEGGAGIEEILLMVEGSRRTARIDVGFEHGYPLPGM